MSEAFSEAIKQPVFWLFITMIIGSAIGIIWFQTPQGKRWLKGNDVAHQPR